jgi:predicted nucleotidyltransferase
VVSGEIKKYCIDNNIRLLVLFGSHATGKVHNKSDMDVAVRLMKGHKVSKLKLIYGLGGFFKDKNIDLVILTKDTDPVLLYEIFFNGKPLYEYKKGIFINEQLRAWKLNIDTRKIRSMNEKYLKDSIRKVSNVA